MKYIRLFVCITLTIISAHAHQLFGQTVDVQRVVKELEPEIRQAMQEGNIPSCAVALVAGKELIWKSAYGYANVWAQTEATTDTVYLIGSTYKTMSSSALLQLMEQGEFQLDDAVRDYLGDLEIEGEQQDKPITFRHLLSHTSGLAAGFGPHRVWGDSVPLRLKDYLAANLRVTKPPANQVVYSNIAFTLVAHLVETISEQPYRKYVGENIFDPLEMNSTAFQPTPIMQERMAVPYVYSQREEKQMPTERLKANVWPAGIVYGTVEDQANWMIAMLNGGQFRDKRILNAETVEQSLQVQFDQFKGNMPKGWGNETAGFGLAWWSCVKAGDRHFAHSGSVPGYTAFLEGNAEEQLGFAILTNGNASHTHLIRLADLAIRLMKENSED